MKSLTLLFISLLFFMTSCTIDRNWENKDTLTPKIITKIPQIKDTSCDKWDNKCELKKICFSKNDHNDIVLDSGWYQYFSTIVTMGDELYYFENTDWFPFWSDIDKSNHKKGTIYSFKKMNCKTYEEKELVSNNEMLRVLEALPQRDNYKYRPYIFGWDVFQDVDFSFFWGILRFKYVSWSEMWGPWSGYNITMNTRTINNADNADWYVNSVAVSIDWNFDSNDGNSKKIEFSTWFYINK